MGTHPNVNLEKFPKQGPFLHQRLMVYFDSTVARGLNGLMVRDDHEEPFRTLILLEDGRIIEAKECIYEVIGPTAPDKATAALSKLVTHFHHAFKE